MTDAPLPAPQPQPPPHPHAQTGLAAHPREVLVAAYHQAGARGDLAAQQAITFALAQRIVKNPEVSDGPE
jgi:hypothetical protein